MLHLEDLILVEDGLHDGHRDAGGALEDAVQLLAAREADVELEEEAIELRFGQRVGALALQGVLRGEDGSTSARRGPILASTSCARG